jgi:hypothetical protein
MPEVSNGGAPGRVTTSIAGLDDVMSGGLPPDRLYLVEREPGSGKTTDSLSEMRFLARDPLRFQRQICGLKQAKGEVRRAISVVKNRTGRHERTIRELRLGPGIQLGVPLKQFQGVLSGVPTILRDGGVRQDGARV